MEHRQPEKKTPNAGMGKEAKKAWRKPTMESETLFDAKVMACGKCRGRNPIKQFACGQFPSVS